MKTIQGNAFLLFLLIVILKLIPSLYGWLCILLCTLFWYLRNRNQSIWIVLVILCLYMIPFYSSTKPTISQGTAIVVKKNYAILANGNQHVLVYTDEPLLYDAQYTIPQDKEKITTTEGFFRFDVQSWALSNGAYYSTDGNECVLRKEHWSLRRVIQKRIEQVEDSNQKENLYRILLNIKMVDDENTDFLYDHGFSYAGMIMIWNWLLKYFISDKKRNIVLLGINILFIIVYHAPLLLVQSFLFRVLRYTKMDTMQRSSCALGLILLLYPGCVTSLSFIIPAVYRFSFLFKHTKRKISLFLILCIQSIFMHQVNIISILLYPFNMCMIGVLWLIGMMTLFIPQLPFQLLCTIVNQCNSFWQPLNLYGSMLGFGLLPYLLCCFAMRKKKHNIEGMIGLFLFFLWTGLFHPLGEVTIINVGQGDSILIREPWNMHNTLIDTGKETQWNALNDYLHSKSITHIDTLVVTHDDSDHSGNREAVIQTYHPTQIIQEHQSSFQSGNITFYDLNTIRNEDKNESCIVLAARINQLNYLFMGDADQKAEEMIVDTYDQLDCNVLKLSHHGSSTGSSDAFLDTVQPQVGLISSGAYQIYHHPSPTTIQKLLKRYIEYFDTKEEGDISILMFPVTNLLITADGKLGIIR